MTRREEVALALTGGFLGALSLAGGVYVGRRLLPRIDKRPARASDRGDWQLAEAYARRYGTPEPDAYDQADAVAGNIGRLRGGR